MESRAKLQRRLLPVTASWCLAASLLVPQAAFADAAVGNGSPPASSNASAYLFSGGTITLKTGRGYFLGIANTGGVTQVNAVTCYDNATNASGPVTFNGVIPLNGNAFPNYPPPFSFGLTCTSQPLVGGGVQIYYR